MAPKFIAARVYVRPLLPDKFKANPDAFLKQIKTVLLRKIRSKLLQETFSQRAKKSLAKAIKVELRPSSLRVVVRHPAFRPLVYGQKKGQMKWLTKAKRPIPIITETGELIFRNATARSMKNGRWIHPGRQPSAFVDRARKEAKAFLKEKFMADLHKQMKTSFKRQR